MSTRESIAKNDGLLLALKKAHEKLLQRHRDEVRESRAKFGRALKAKRHAAFVDLHVLAARLGLEALELESIESGFAYEPTFEKMNEENCKAAEKFIAAAWKRIAKP